MNGPMGKYTTAAAEKFEQAHELWDNKGMKMTVVGLGKNGLEEDPGVVLSMDLVGKGVWGILTRKLATGNAETVETFFVKSHAVEETAFFKTDVNQNHAEMAMLKKVEAMLKAKDKAKAKFVFVQSRGPCTKCLGCLATWATSFGKLYPDHFDSLSIVYNEHYLKAKGLDFTWDTEEKAIEAYAKACEKIPLRIRSMSKLKADRDKAKAEKFQKSLKKSWTTPLTFK